MRNAETPRLKFALYGAHCSLGSALLVELLSRQHEAVALLDDLNSLTARPGLRTKPADLYDPISVSESVAGMDAVLCLFNADRLPSSPASPQGFEQAQAALLSGLPRVNVDRLLLVADFPRIEQDPSVQRGLQQLTAMPLRWTLIDAEHSEPGLSIEDLALASGDPQHESLRRLAAGIVEELEQPRHLRERIHFRL
ncbi:NAD(P)H-binding protein [Stutzerimonas balearica]|uniref:NAD(P)H-binding protein n=1 Tax=Stutzerimonas balearica TaxID=74829 RepID=UPI00289C02D1|nr:NAD(P)H-binding protein [Stutzerimonas balearica]